MGKEASAVASASSHMKRLSRLPAPRVFTGGNGTEGGGAPIAAAANKANGTWTASNGYVTDKGGTRENCAVWAGRIGSHVCVGGAKTGILLYYGDTQFASGVWCGVMLDEPVGKNDGAVAGVRYFTCKQGHGIFAPPHRVQLSEESGPADEGVAANTTVVRSRENGADAFDSMCDSVRKTWPPPGCSKSSSRTPVSLTKAHSSRASIHGVDLDPSTKSHSSRKMLPATPGASSRPSKLKPKTGAQKPLSSADLDTTVTLSAGAASHAPANPEPAVEAPSHATMCTEAEHVLLDATYCRPMTPKASLPLAGETAAAHSLPIDSGAPWNNDTYLVDHCDLNGTFTVDGIDYGDPLNEADQHRNSTFCQPSDRGGPVKSGTSLSAGCLLEVTERQCETLSSDDLWKFVDNYEEDEGLVEPEFGTSGEGCLGRQGSLDLDESLGILTPDQMRDFTLAAGDTLPAQTPSDEGIQEIVEEEVATDLESRLVAGFCCSAPQTLADTAFVESPVVGVVASVLRRLNHPERLPDGGAAESPVNLVSRVPVDNMTSTPVRSEDLHSEASVTGITEMLIPESRHDTMHYSFASSLGCSSVLRKPWKPDVQLELDVSTISPCSVHSFLSPDLNRHAHEAAPVDGTFEQPGGILLDDKAVDGHAAMPSGQAVVEEPTTGGGGGDDDAHVLPDARERDGKRRRGFEVDSLGDVVSAIAEKAGDDAKGDCGEIGRLAAAVDGKMGTLSCLLDGGGRGGDAVSELSAALKKEYRLPLEVCVADPLASAGLDGATEFLIQHVCHSFVEHVAETTKKEQQQPPSAMAVSITSTDTGYQGDAECDLQSDAGTNAANTPVEDVRKEFELSMLAEVGKHLKGDPGSDSDFCSDMAASLTESEMEGDERGRGRGARIIDGRLYYSSASITKDGGVSASNDSEVEELPGGDQTLQKAMPPDVNSSLNLPEGGVAGDHVACDAFHRQGVENATCVSVSDDVTVFETTVRSGNVSEAVAKQCAEEGTRAGQEDGAEITTVHLEVSTGIHDGTLTVDASESKPGAVEATLVRPPPSEALAAVVIEEWGNDVLRGKNGEVKTSQRSAKGTAAPKMPSSSKKDASKEKLNDCLGVGGKKGAKKDSPGSVGKKSKSPKRNVMSKIKAMIEATSHILTNKESPASAASLAAAGELDRRKALLRTPKRSRWDAVMSKIAAGQAEEKVKTKREVTSKVNTNLASSKSPRPETRNNKGVGETQHLTRPAKFRAKTDIVGASVQRSLARGSSSDAMDVSLQSRSEASASRLSGREATSKLPRSGKQSRPSTLNLGPVVPSTNSRSPSQASGLSNLSRGSTSSQLTLASQASTRPPQDISYASLGEAHFQNRSHGRSGVPPATGTVRKAPSTRQPSAGLQQSRSIVCPSRVGQVSTHNRPATSSEATEIAAGSSAAPRRLLSRLPVPKARAAACGGSVGTVNGSRVVREKPKSSYPSQPIGCFYKEQSQLKPLKSSSGLVNGRSVSQQDNRLHTSTAARCGSAATTASREVTRLEALCEARTKELNYVRLQLKHCAMGFDSLAVLLQYMAHELNAFSTPVLSTKLKQVQDELIATRTNLEESRGEQKRQEDELAVLREQSNSHVEEVVRRLKHEMEESRQRLLGEHAVELAKVADIHRKEVESLNEKRNVEMSAVQRAHEEQLQEVVIMLEEKSRKAMERHDCEMEESERLHKAEQNLLKLEHEQVRNALEEKLGELKCDCEALRSQTRSLKEELMNDSDYRVHAATGRCATLQNEVDSLKAVLDLRFSEMQDLRREKLELINQAEELSAAKERIKKLVAKNEDLQAMVDIRLRNERQLSSERQTLMESFEKESKVSKRLSMENEELHWRLQQHKEMDSILTPIDGSSDSSFTKGEPTQSGSMSMYFWDHEGLLNSSMNGGVSNSLKTCFSCFKGQSGATMRMATSPAGSSPHHSPRISPSKSPSGLAAHGRPVSAPICARDRSQRTSVSEDSLLESEKQQLQQSSSRCERSPKRRKALRHSFDPRMAASLSTDNNKMKHGLAKGSVGDEIVVSPGGPAALPPINPEYRGVDDLTEDILVENEAFDVIDDAVDLGERKDVAGDRLNGQANDTESCAGRVSDELSRSSVVPESQDVISDGCCERHHVGSIKSVDGVSSKTELSQSNDVPNFTDGLCPEDSYEITGTENREGRSSTGEEERLEETSLESGSTAADQSADDVSSGKEAVSIESCENPQESGLQSPFSSPDHCGGVSKTTTTTLTISFRSTLRSVDSSRGSSPIPPVPGTASESCESQSSESSSRASPLGRGEPLPNKSMHLVDTSLFDGTCSPRAAAGESMVLDELPCPRSEASHLLLRKALQDQMLCENGESSASSVSLRESMELCAQVTPADSSPLPEISKPNTPESTSQAVVRTDSTNMDLSWSEDDMPSETEV